MRKKEKWMFKGAIVIAIKDKAVITKMEENTLNGVDYVYNIFCKVEGRKHANCYHPNDVQELILPTIKA